VIDASDACPDTPGAHSDDPSKNGCPPDRDGDGIPDAQDACPDTPGTRSDDASKNGCPPDRDGDGIPDAEDACPNTKGQRSNDPSENGCPADRDGDGIEDSEDACPDAFGERNEDRAKNGCPAARVEQGQIKILERIEFKTNSAELLDQSLPVLQAVQKLLLEHADITRVSVEGHTDNKGSAEHNQRLSQRRAEAVMQWLTKHEIARARLEAHGFGFERPLESNDTEQGRERNRRVEFHIKGSGE
jgi:outer membrane protein OmpA-like peptidoglycan-associated protein